MEDLLVDIHLAEGYMDYYSSEFKNNADREKMMASVFKKHGIDKAQFDTSLVWYSNHLDTYMKVYTKAYDRLSKSNNVLKEELALVERSLMSPAKDSADVWNLARAVVLDPLTYRLNNAFEIKTDSNYKPGDKLTLEVKLINIPADSIAYAVTSLGFIGKKDSSIIKTVIPEGNGWHTLELHTDSTAVPKSLFGNFVLIVRDNDNVKPVYVDSIRLMRYHKKEELLNDPTR